MMLNWLFLVRSYWRALADGTGFQRKLKQATGHVIDSSMHEATNRLAELLEGTGVKCPPVIFTSDWPAKIDRQSHRPA